MPALVLQLGGLALSTLGCPGAVLSCALPMWKVTAFIGSNIIVAQVFWEGLWMSCVHESTGQTQCKAYDSLLDLPADLQAARALVVASIAAAAVLALLVTIVGAKCTRCADEPGTKGRVSAGAGAGFLLAGLALLIPVSWSARTIISNFYNPLVPEALKRELGLPLYVGWVASALLGLGGAMLCCLSPPPGGQQEGLPGEIPGQANTPPSGTVPGRTTCERRSRPRQACLQREGGEGPARFQVCSKCRETTETTCGMWATPPLFSAHMWLVESETGA